MEKRKFLFASLSGLIGDIAWQVLKEGHDVRYFIDDEKERDIADGFVPKSTRLGERRRSGPTSSFSTIRSARALARRPFARPANPLSAELLTPTISKTIVLSARKN